MNERLTLDYKKLPKGHITSAGRVDMGGALTLESVPDELPYYHAHTWPDVSLTVAPHLTFEEIERATRLLLAQMSLLKPLPKCGAPANDALRCKQAQEVANVRALAWPIHGTTK